MHLSLFRPRKKLYATALLCWMAAAAGGGIYYYLKGVSFGLERGVLLDVLALCLLCAVLAWIPLYRDKHPTNRIWSYPWPLRWLAHVVLLVAFFFFVFATIHWLVGPLLTRSLGTPFSDQFVVSKKSSGYPERRSCDHYVRITTVDLTWSGKACLTKGFWQVVEVGQVMKGSGHLWTIGRTVEQLDANGS